MLKATDVKKIYKTGTKEVRAVDGISLDIRKGESLAIVGPSGSGKSTLLHMLGGLDRPTSGSVLMEGLDLYSMSDSKRSKTRNLKVGFIFQAYHLLPEFTALENVILPAAIRGRVAHSGNGTGLSNSFPGMKGRAAKEKAKELLGLVGLGDRMDHRPGELSGGESQRVAIARALINEPQVLLCDEPTGNLDSSNSETIHKALFGLKAKFGISLVIVTHDNNISRNLDRTIRLKDGRIV